MSICLPAPRHQEQHLLPTVQYLGEGFGLKRLLSRFRRAEPASADEHRETRLEQFRFAQLYLLHAGKASATY